MEQPLHTPQPRSRPPHHCYLPRLPEKIKKQLALPSHRSGVPLSLTVLHLSVFLSDSVSSLSLWPLSSQH
jgi:hypothetical protein